MSRFPTLRVAMVCAVLAPLTAGTASAAVQQLPPGGQVNDDAAAGIDPHRDISGADPANADVVGGALTAGNPTVPWAVLRQQTAAKDQIFSRSFAGGAWTTRGTGTVGGKSDNSPAFPGSLNFDQAEDGEAPSIDFAGPGRTVPWASWYEHVGGAGFNHTQIFSSRFNATTGKWLFGGQGRDTTGGTPSLNIHTTQEAENPSIAGGSAADPTKPGPWVTWQETSKGTGNKDQIFVEKPIGPAAANCDGVKPLGTLVNGHVPAIGGFCWQQTGVERGPAGATDDPSLNVDPTRDGIEPDIAFTGPSDSVPWVVWYETGATGTTNPKLHDNDMVFAAKGVADANADGGFKWVAVGGTGTGALDASDTKGFGPCAASPAAEAGCSVNKDGDQDAEDPRVAAGTMVPGGTTAPWIAWTEKLNGTNQVFVSRLVGGTHFELANNGAPISISANPSTRPDITFSHNTPYVTWRENTGGGVDKGFSGHFVGPATNPTFVLDTSDVSLTPSAQADVRLPISSNCIATPFSSDGAACPGGAAGTPFFLFTNGTGPRKLLADAYASDAPVTGAASAITTTTATLAGTVNPQGAEAKVRFDFGTTTAYGQSTATQPVAVANSATPFTADLSGLAPATVVHYRSVVTTDFGTTFGPDATFTTGTVPPNPDPNGNGNTPPPPVKKDHTAPKRTVSLHKSTIKRLLARKPFALGVKLSEAGKITVSSTVAVKSGRHTKHVTLAKTARVTYTKAGTKSVSLKPSSSARRLLRHATRATLTVKVRATDRAGNAATTTKTVTLNRR